MIFFSKCKCSRKYHDHRQNEKIPSMPEGIPELPSVPGSGSGSDSEIEFVAVGDPDIWPSGHPNNPESPFPNPEEKPDVSMVPEVPVVPVEPTSITACLENYEKAKKDAIKENKANHLMLEMDDCVKGKLMEPGRCTMERFKEIYTKCEKGIIGEIKEFIENDETVHQLFHFAHEN